MPAARDRRESRAVAFLNSQLPTPKVAYWDVVTLEQSMPGASLMADDWRIPHKPYDLRERLFQFACITVRVVEFLNTRGPVAKALSYQLLKCARLREQITTKAMTVQAIATRWAKRKISLREMKETRFRLRVLRQCGYLIPAQEPAIVESDELVRILATLVRKGRERRSRGTAWELGVGSGSCARIPLGVGRSSGSVYRRDRP